MTIQQKLGYPENTKLLIIHADDAGLCHSENLATIHALQKGNVNSYSIMVPCPGFVEMAEFALENPQFDYGIHLTLTCEWQNFKWAPVLPINQVSSLVDHKGYFHQSKKEVKNRALSNEIKKELRAQIDKAFDMGLKPSHLDSHMYTLGLKEDFLKVYKELGKEYNLPILLSKQFITSFGLDISNSISETDLIIDNDILLGHYSQFEEGRLIENYKNQLNNLSYGLHIFLLHTAFDTLEMQNITIDHPNFGSEWRQMDYDFITSKECLEILNKNEIQLVTWGEIKEVFYP
jgi:predicted glycoside hydrolase/deacetylase ChbG (UPF0249 family)